MSQISQTSDQTLNDIIAWRPALASILTAFSPLLSASESLISEVVKILPAEQLNFPPCDPSRFQQGISLLASYKFPDLGVYFVTARDILWPEFSKLPAFQGLLDSYYQFFAKVAAQDQALLFRSVIDNDVNLLADISTAKDLDVGVLHFLATFICSNLLKAMVEISFGKSDIKKEWPWDTNNVWQQGYCPVCGSFPIIAWLDKAVIDERNTYLLEGGGRKHLHCGVCGANWRFLRLACPSCGIANSKQIEILTCEDNTHGESLDWCNKCNAYLPTVDLRERLNIPNLDAQAIGMLHLELIAKEKNLCGAA